ncbi:MAG: GTPase RsgA, partial [candidate division Zixibacteria bacterium]|nr:GTPase RsgA [candidate division Zixibacteria bacterium]
KTGAVRAVDSKGRHTTTWREMLVLPRGGVVIDTPGLREMQVWASEEDIENTFEDVEQLARQCRFRNCTHTSEQGCAVLQAIKDRTLDAGRLGNYIRLYEDVRYLESRKKEKSAK